MEGKKKKKVQVFVDIYACISIILRQLGSPIFG